MTALSAPDPAPTCEHCGGALEVTLARPFGRGQRTWPGARPYAEARRLAALRQRELEATQRRARQLMGQSGIGVRHHDARFDTFAVTAASQPIVDACRRYVETFGEGGAGLTLAGPPGTGKTHLAPQLVAPRSTTTI